jgi:hypothetical protein
MISVFAKFKIGICRLECDRTWISSPGLVKSKTLKSVFVASPLNRQH